MSEVVVVGAGPVGLAAAAQLLERGLEPLVLERGERAGAAVAQWHHVRLFSSWAELVDPAAGRLLEPTGWVRPVGYPTGREWAESYLRPLADVLGERVRFGAEVVGVARRGRDRVVDSGRDTEPFSVHVRTAGGAEERLFARAVIDASGTWGGMNPLGGEGLPAIGEAAAADRIVYRVPDLGDPATHARYAGRHIVVAGSGHSALTALVALSAQDPSPRISWALRRGGFGNTFGGGDADQLPARGALGMRARAAVEAGLITVVTGFRTETVERDAADRLTLVSAAGQRLEEVDEVVTLTGFRPQLDWLSEIRLELDPTLQAPARLAPLVDPNVHSCGTVYPHGAKELTHPEQDFYLAGMKSYGRAPTFLAQTGYEQVRSIAAELAGDHEAATRVDLTLSETGVCGGAGLFDETDSGTGGCCGPTATAATSADATGATSASADATAPAATSTAATGTDGTATAPNAAAADTATSTAATGTDGTDATAADSAAAADITAADSAAVPQPVAAASSGCCGPAAPEVLTLSAPAPAARR